MPGSPKKRARREAKEREAATRLAQDSSTGRAPACSGEVAGSTPAPAPTNSINGEPASAEQAAPVIHLPAPAVPLVEGTLEPVGAAPEPTRTALKRAMRARAQEHAAEAIAVLVENMRNSKLAPDKRESAANKLLEWGFGKPAQEIEAGEGSEMIVIRKFVGADNA